MKSVRKSSNKVASDAVRWQEAKYALQQKQYDSVSDLSCFSLT